MWVQGKQIHPEGRWKAVYEGSVMWYKNSSPRTTWISGTVACSREEIHFRLISREEFHLETVNQRSARSGVCST